MYQKGQISVSMSQEDRDIKACEYYEKAAQFLHSGALTELGYFLEKSRGKFRDQPSVDYTRVAALYKKATEGDNCNPTANNFLGLLFYKQKLRVGNNMTCK